MSRVSCFMLKDGPGIKWNFEDPSRISVTMHPCQGVKAYEENSEGLRKGEFGNEGLGRGHDG